MNEELLLEIGTEEIPAAFLKGALDAFKMLVENNLKENRIDFKSINTFGTPRRLVLMGFEVASGQKDVVIKKVGPAKTIAYDKDGNPTKAAIGFARGQGISPDNLSIIKTEKGEYICAEKKEIGRKTINLLSDLIPKAISSIPFPKSMRWSNLDIRFARPVHWVLALFGDKKIPFVFGNIESGDITCGHRFMSPEQIAVTGISSYRNAMQNAGVEIDPAIRKKIIEEKTKELSEKIKGKPDEDESLLDEVTNLVESPFPVMCGFDEVFLELPKAVLLTTMKKHQKYFPVLDSEGNPLPCFVAVNNTKSLNPEVVITGHERVLRARLSDAKFFCTEDQKKSLDAMTEELKQVVFQSKLGTSYEKVLRFQKLALFMADLLLPPSEKQTIERAAYLCKADLVSEMVGEFPELQGIMGEEYARAAGETEEAARAIFEHYLPRFAGDRLPISDAGAIISIADKLDTIAGCFCIGLVPSGTADPYALRRQSIGIINIILDRRYSLCFPDIISKTVRLLEDKAVKSRDKVCEDVLEFFSGRLLNLLATKGFSHDVIDAVLSLGVEDIADTVNRVDALQQMKKDSGFESLCISFKRVVNILAGKSSQDVDKSLFENVEEKELYQKYHEIRNQAEELMAQKSYVEALKIISTIRQAVDNFFDNVLVMAENEKIKQNRLSLLYEISTLFTDFADFSRIASDQQG